MRWHETKYFSELMFCAVSNVYNWDVFIGMGEKVFCWTLSWQDFTWYVMNLKHNLGQTKWLRSS